MAQNNNWLYFNIHNLLRIRVQAGHASERSVKLVFGAFETEHLDEFDLALQYNPPEMGEHSFASESYLFTDQHVYIKEYKLHFIKNQGKYILASERDLLPFIMPPIQYLLLEKQHCFIHSAAIAVDGEGILLPGWGGTGKTSAIICLLKQVPGSAFMSDDYVIISSGGQVLYFPKAFFIYPYHRELFPHLFKTKHKPLVPPIFSPIIEKIRTVVRPTVMAFPKLENLARRITPEHMQIPARTALPDAKFVESVPLKHILFIERYSGDKTQIDELDVQTAKKRLTGNWYFEQGQCARDLMLGAAGTGIMSFESYFSAMTEIIERAFKGRKIYRLRMPKMIPEQTGKAVIDAICKLKNY